MQNKTFLQCSCFRGDKRKKSRPLPLLKVLNENILAELKLGHSLGLVLYMFWLFPMTNDALKPSLTSQFFFLNKHSSREQSYH